MLGRSTAIVEVNFKDKSARLVETSDAPKLTAEVLRTKGKPVKTVEMFFDDQMWQGGSPGRQTAKRLEVEHMKLLLEYEGQSTRSCAAMEERDRIIAISATWKNDGGSRHFPIRVTGEGTPIEARSSYHDRGTLSRL